MLKAAVTDWRKQGEGLPGKMAGRQLPLTSPGREVPGKAGQVSRARPVADSH